MEPEPPPPPFSSSSSKNDTKLAKTTDLFPLTDDLLHKILSRLPAVSFASAACVSKSWNHLCNQVLSRPKLASALSLDPSPEIAVSEVVDKVLAEPIRPHFVLASIGSGFRLYDVSRLISRKLGSKTPLIISTSLGVIGRDAVTDEVTEVKWISLAGDLSDDDGSVTAEDDNFGIVLTVGFVPGLVVDVVPLLRPTKEPRNAMLEKFVTDIRGFCSSVSGGQSPVAIIVFGMEQEGLVDMKPIVNILGEKVLLNNGISKSNLSDYAMPKETVIVGDERGRFLYKSGNESRNFCGSAKYFTDAVALVFAKDRNRAYGNGNIQFHVALSNGVTPVGPRYKAASVKRNCSDHSTWLTAKLEGQQAVLDGQRILNDINDELGDHAGSSDLYIGVTTRRNCSIRSEKPRLLTSLAFHGVVEGDEEYLYVSGEGIRTGDYFQFYRSDPEAALSSIISVTQKIQNLKLDQNQKNSCSQIFGGLIFSCYGRSEPFFASNVDSVPFLENLAEVPFGGIFCGGEIGRGPLSLVDEDRQESPVSCCLHVYSTVYLVMTCTPP
ncbi:hypothetical protein F8388_007606 [Cannabis sativa]|uniref:F-box/LRR-repeat protein n=1 Tax=Cannabis sativa TaxID=3483 RepID=A0A7J6ETX6_CANSA|nr:hypothetical protein G4B88_027679 [Cannabis sativa]KAF4361590.1 hypothetical protein F8388_007606 [Cannabis sativa]